MIRNFIRRTAFKGVYSFRSFYTMTTITTPPVQQASQAIVMPQTRYRKKSKRHNIKAVKVEKIVSESKIKYNPWQAIRLMKAFSHAGFDESIDICIKMNINPRNGEQIVRGNAIMPSGTGKQIIVAVYCPEEFREIATKAGADMIIDKAGIEDIKANRIKFERLYSTPELVGDLKPYAKNLGPKGLMPNLKVGTLVLKEKLSDAIKQAKEGEVVFKVDTGKTLKSMIGKISFTEQQILENMRSFMNVIAEKRPLTIKGKYLVEAWIKTTMGPRFTLNLDSIDPKSRNYMLGIRE